MKSIRSLITLLKFKPEQKGFNKFDNMVNRSTNSVFNLKNALMAVAGVGLVGGGFALKAAGEMEQANIAFETMLGSAEKGQEMMRKLREFTLQTPFAFKQASLGAKRLMAFGIAADDIIPALTNLGNIASGVGMYKLKEIITAYGQIKTAGVLRGQEIRQLTESGIDITVQLGKMMGITAGKVVELSRKGKISFNQVKEAITRMSTGTGRFANLLERQSKSFLGMISIGRDLIYLMASDLGKVFMPVVKGLMKDSIKALKEFGDIIKDTILPSLREFTEGGKMVGEAIKAIKAWFKILATSAAFIFVSKVIWGIGKGFKWAAAGVLALKVAVVALVMAIQDLWLSIVDSKADTAFNRFIKKIEWIKKSLNWLRKKLGFKYEYTGAKPGALSWEEANKLLKGVQTGPQLTQGTPAGASQFNYKAGDIYLNIKGDAASGDIHKKLLPEIEAKFEQDKIKMQRMMTKKKGK